MREVYTGREALNCWNLGNAVCLDKVLRLELRGLRVHRDERKKKKKKKKKKEDRMELRWFSVNATYDVTAIGRKYLPSRYTDDDAQANLRNISV